MLEALWSVRFISNSENVGGGVAVFETGRVIGGDSQYTYVGTFSVSGGEVSARIEVNNYFGPGYSVFGPLKTYALILKGAANASEFELTGEVEGDPEKRIFIKLERCAELP